MKLESKLYNFDTCLLADYFQVHLTTEINNALLHALQLFLKFFLSNPVRNIEINIVYKVMIFRENALFGYF